MAQSIETLRSLIMTSLYGRRLGFDKNDFIIGSPGMRRVIQDIQSTVPTTVNTAGLVRILTSGSSQGPTQHNLPAPIPGAELTIALNSTSTGSQQFLSTPNGASIFLATAGTTIGVINFVGPGGSITLIGGTTASWVVKSLAGSTAGGAPSFSTST